MAVAANRSAEALPQLEQVCRADPRDADAWFGSPPPTRRWALFEQAADAHRQVIALKPDYADAHYYLGNTDLALGCGLAAIASFEQATRLRPDYLGRHTSISALLELQKNWAAAETSFREALRLDPKNAERHYSLGNILQLQDKLRRRPILPPSAGTASATRRYPFK